MLGVKGGEEVCCGQEEVVGRGGSEKKEQRKVAEWTHEKFRRKLSSLSLFSLMLSGIRTQETKKRQAGDFLCEFLMAPHLLVKSKTPYTIH